MAEIKIVPCFTDNYAYLVHDAATATTLAVDPADESPILHALQEHDWKLNYILCTHHHADHVGGNLSLKEKTECQIIGYRADELRIPGIDTTVESDEVFKLGQIAVKVLFTPGHTSGHVSYHLPQLDSVFCGDVLFSLGCGRLLEGTAEEMFNSLQSLARLTDNTAIYCGHEYTLNNLHFALSVDCDNQELLKRGEEVKALRAAEKPTLPTTIGNEKLTNPFLRTSVNELQARLNTSNALETFKKLRALKDNF